MSTHWVDDEGRYDGRSLVEWVPEVVQDVIAFADPLRVILFGSVARGEAGPDSDIDLLVVVPQIAAGGRHRLMGSIRAAIGAPVPVDVFVAEPADLADLGDAVGSLVYWPVREGRVVYERAA